MNYKVISHDYRNNGGNNMVYVFQVYLPDENRTVFVNCCGTYANMTTVDYIGNFDPDDYDDITIDEAVYSHKMFPDHLKYYDVFQRCLFEYAKIDCWRNDYRMDVPYVWLPLTVRLQISDTQREFVEDELSGEFCTDGYNVYVPTPDGDDVIPVVSIHKSLHDTLAACLGRLTDKLDVEGEFMDDEDTRSLRETIADVIYYMDENN